MKKLLSIAIMLMSALAGMAQSSDLYYPMGGWHSTYNEENEGKDYLQIFIHRVSEEVTGYKVNSSCGELHYGEYDAILKYISRGMDQTGRPNNVFSFVAIDGQGHESQLDIEKIMGDESPSVKIVTLEGYLARKIHIKQVLTPCMYANGSHWYDFTFEAQNYKQFLDALQDGAKAEDELKKSGETEYIPVIKGFGNLRQFINAHQNLTYGKPVYAKCKGNSAVNIRSKGDISAQKVGELLPNTSLLVVDEYDGWCQLHMDGNKFGWVKLSTVMLSNDAPAVSSQQQTTKRIVRGDLGIFDLYGPVKAFTFANEWGSVKRTFDRNGLWLTMDGKSLKTIYQKGIRRNQAGRLIKGVFDIDGNAEEYFYDAGGRIVKRDYHFFDTTEIDTYSYDTKGNLQKMHVEEGGMDAAEPYTEFYEIQDTDKHGNWTKRKVKNGTESRVETRVIVYYE